MAGEARLADLCEAIVDCSHSTPVWTDAGVVVLRNQNIRNGRLHLSDRSYTDEAHFAERTRRATPMEGDLVITREAPMGEVCMIPPGLRCCLGQRMVLLRPNRERAEPRYLLYALQSKAVQHEIGVSEGTGSTVSNLRIPLLGSLPIPTRPLPEQRSIAHILGTLDDKIELNRRMNDTLEAMARALFKSWFVDFDPVRAKAEGRDPGLPKPLANLFPARLVDSELGEMPEGWEVKKLGDLLELAYGKGLKAEDRRDGNIPVYGSNGQVGWHDERLVAGPGIVVGRKGNPGIATWVPTDFFPIDTSFYVVPKSSSGGLQFLFQVLSNHDLVSLGADSAVPGLNRNLAYMSGQLLPPSPLLTQFERLASAFSRRENSVNDESRTLSALRDSLLPKLISGELRLDDAEKFIAGVAP